MIPELASYVMSVLPPDFLARFQQICPPALLDTALASFDQPKAVHFRVNLLKAQSAVVLAQLSRSGLNCRPVDWLQDCGIPAFSCEAAQRELLTRHPLAETGEIYIQGLSSMLAPLLLQPAHSDWILDLAAAPGGKTILLADMMQNQGEISAVEPVTSRFHRLRANLQRCGVTNTRTYLKDGRAVGSLKPAAFDRVLLDAPCSSESRFRSAEPDSMAHWSLRKVAETAHKQKRLLLSAFDALKPGGMLIYCTCAYSPEENELVVAHLLHKRPAALLPISLPLANQSAGITGWQGKTLPESLQLTCRIWPDQDYDGFYLARLSKPLT